MDLIQFLSCFMFYNIFYLVLLISRKAKGCWEHFYDGDYPHQPAAVYLFVKSVNLYFMLEFQSDVIKDVSSAKMSHSFAAVKVLMKRTFFAFSPFLFLFMRSKGCSMFLLELVMVLINHVPFGCMLILSWLLHLA